jgi:hypothetical protein
LRHLKPALKNLGAARRPAAGDCAAQRRFALAQQQQKKLPKTFSIS